MAYSALQMSTLQGVKGELGLGFALIEKFDSY